MYSILYSISLYTQCMYITTYKLTTQTGRLRRGCMAVIISPSPDSPSVAMTRQAFWPEALSCPSILEISWITSRICLQSGVPPVGESSRRWLRVWKRCASPASGMPTRIGGPPLRKRNSVGEFAACARPAWNFNDSVNSCQRVHITNLEHYNS